MRTSLLLSFLLLSACGQVAPEVDAPPAASSPPATPPPAAPTHEGYVSLTSYQGELTADAYFPRDNALGMPIGACAIRPISDVPTPPAWSANAGDLVVETPSKSSLTIAYDTKSSTYTPAMLDGIDAKQFHVVGKGADVPAFDATVLSADDITLTSPSAPLTLTPTSGPITLTWKPTANAFVLVTLSLVESEVACRFDASAQQGVIPADLVDQAVSQRLAAAKDNPCVGTCSMLSFLALRSTETIAGDWRVSVTHTSGSVVAVDPQADP